MTHSKSDFRIFFLTLWRKKLLILSVVLGIMGVVFYLTSFLTPQYMAKSLILVEDKPELALELKPLISSAQLNRPHIMGEVEVLKSRSLARSVIGRLDLMSDPDFSPLIKGGKKNKIEDIFSSGEEENLDQKSFKSISVYKQEIAGMPIEVTNQNLGIAIDRLLKGLSVRSMPESFMLQVEFISDDAFQAARITNSFVDLYMKQRIARKSKLTQNLSKWLDSRLEFLQRKVSSSKAAVQKFKIENDLVGVSFMAEEMQILSERRARLKLEKLKWEESKSRILQGTGEDRNSHIIESFKDKEVVLLNRISKLSARYGEKHPAMIDAREELSELRAKIKETWSTGDDVDEFLERFPIVSPSLDVAAENNAVPLMVSDSFGDALDTPLADARGQLQNLEAELKSYQLALDSLLATYRRADGREKLQGADARVISYATVPHEAMPQNKILFLSLAFAFSLFLGSALALFLERLDNSYKTSTQLENEAGYPCFGIVPLATNLEHAKPIADYVLGSSASTIAEAVRTLRMVLNLRSPDQEKRSKVITVTSSLPNEGKTTLSSWMGRLAAKSGEKTIIIDCDLRRPKLSEAFGKDPQNTLVEYLSGRATLEEVIFHDPVSGAHVIFARAAPNNALDLLGKTRMKNLINALRESYDLIILDSPACLAVSDARLLASQSDQTLFAVSWDDTPREVVNAGVKQFADFGYDALAFVLTNVDIKRHSKYGYGDAVYYYGLYKQYYSD